MHKCLTIPELLDYIAQWLSFDRTDKLNTALFEGGLIPPSTTPSDATPHSLLSFASTCRAFYEPSMNVIWHTLFSLKPLVKCFPRHVWQEVDHAVVRYTPIMIKTLRWVIIHVISSFIDYSKTAR